MMSARTNADTRYLMTAQFLCSSALFVRRCKQIEQEHPENPDDETRTEHQGLVTAVIMQCAAAVEAESAEITLHGPGGHLGSNGVDGKAHDFLAPFADFIDRQEALERYDLILRLLHKSPLPKGEQPRQDMSTLVSVRNELIHYKSRMGQKMDEQKLFKTLRQLHIMKPPFIPTSGINFFPHQFLSAACAAWSVRTAVEFINAIYQRLGVVSPLKPRTEHFKDMYADR
jgi:hypothetical protein